MYLNYLFYLETLSNVERKEHVLIIISVFAILFIIGILEIIIKGNFSIKKEDFKKIIKKIKISNNKTKKEL